MHVAYLINTLENAGAERMVKDIVTHPTSESVSFSVIQLGGGDALRDEIERSGSSVRNVGGPLDVRSVPGLVARTRRVLEEVEPDILHTHLPLSHGVGRLAGTLAGTPHVVSTYHSVPRHKGRLKTAVERMTESMADEVVTVSDGISQAYGASRGWTTIHNGIDVEKFASDGNRGTDDWPYSHLASASPLLLNVGRCVPSKQQEDLVRAMEYVTREVPDAHLLIVGSGPRMDVLRETVEALDLDDSVTLAGYDANVSPYYANADVFVSSSINEGLPTTHLEAMATKLPIVSTDIPGVREVVRDGETGSLVPPERPRELADAVVRLVESGDAKAMGERGYALVRQQFTIENTVDEHVDLYSDLVSQ